jgi:hypothetical protein
MILRMCQILYLLAGYLLLLFVHRNLRMEMVNLNLHFILLTALSLSFIHVAAITCSCWRSDCNWNNCNCKDTFTYSPLFDLASSLVSGQLKRNFCRSHMTAEVTIKKLNDLSISSMLFLKCIQMNSRLRGKLVHLSNSQAQGPLPPNPSPCPEQHISAVQYGAIFFQD